MMKLYTTENENVAVPAEMQELKIYRIRLWVLERKRGGGYKDTPAESADHIVINNLPYAESFYREYLNKFQMWKQSGSKYVGFVELFEAYVFENGDISSYPDQEKYIQRVSTQE